MANKAIIDIPRLAQSGGVFQLPARLVASKRPNAVVFSQSAATVGSIKSNDFTSHLRRGAQRDGLN